MNLVTYASNDFDWLTGDSDGGMFKSLIDIIQQTGNEVYALLFTIGVVCAVAAIAIIAITLLVGGQQGREKAKSSALYVIVAILVLVSIPAILISVANIGKQINDDVKANPPAQKEEEGTEGTEGLLSVPSGGVVAYITEEGEVLVRTDC